MSTNAYIGYIENDVYHYIYSHWDGYFDHVGKMLYKHYNIIEAAKSLVALGSISFLDSTLEKTIAYHRDRGEDLSIETISVDEISSLRIEYTYVFNDGRWFYYNDGFHELEKEIK